LNSKLLPETTALRLSGFIVIMHWYHLPKVKHNEDAVREYERGESQKLGGWIKRLVIALPFILLVLWLILHK
jgi:hypothetical protein